MDKTNVINAVEKRELAKIMEVEFDKIISNMKQEMQYTESEILEQAEKKFGIKYIDKEIKQLQVKIKMLEEQKGKLGFNTGYNGGFNKKYVENGEVVDPNTKAGRFFYLKVSRNVDIQNLEKQKNDRLKNLWLSSDRGEVKELALLKPDIKLLNKPKDK